MREKKIILALLLFVSFLFLSYSTSALLFNVSSSSYTDVGLLALSNTTFVQGSMQNGQVNLKLFNTVGTLLNSSSPVTGLGSSARLKLTLINQSVFVVAWYDNTLLQQNIKYQLYNYNLGSLGAQQTGPSMGGLLTNNVDFGLASVANRLFVCFTNDLTNNVELNIINMSSLGAGTNVVLDATGTPEASNQQLITCSIFNESRISVSYFDDVTSNNINTLVVSDNGTVLFNRNLDTTAGETGQIDDMAVYRNITGIAWYDSSDSNIYFAITSRNSTPILAATSIDNNAGSDSRVIVSQADYQQKNVFIVSWNDLNSLSINTKVFSDNGSELFFYNTSTDQNTTNLFFSTYGRNNFYDIGLCSETYVVTYQNRSGISLARTVLINGSSWDGLCDNSPPVLSNIQPVNASIFLNPVVSFNATITDDIRLLNATLTITNSSGTVISYNSSLLSGNTTFFNKTFTFTTYGDYFYNFTAYDFRGKSIFSFTRVLTYINPNSSVSLRITYPVDGASYTSHIRGLNYTLFASPLVGSCWYSLDLGLSNFSIVCGNNVSTLLSFIGSNTWRVYANHSITGAINFSSVTFTDACMDVNPTLVLPSYPYLDFNVSSRIQVGYFASDDPALRINITDKYFSNFSFPLVYNSSTQTFDIFLIFNETGDYPFKIYGNTSNNTCPRMTEIITGTFLVRSPFFITINAYDNRTKNPYINEFAYFTAEFEGFKKADYLNQFVIPLKFKDTFFTPVFHAKYTNGQAVLKLWDKDQSYTFRLWDGIATFPSSYSIPNITKTYGTNIFLGTFYLNGSSTSYEFLLTQKDLHPYRWLLNALFIVGLILTFLIAGALFIRFPFAPWVSLIFAVLFTGIILSIRLVLWWYGW